jgi:hypothetical protein
MRNKIHFYILSSFIIIFLSVFALAPSCKFLTETDKSKWPPPKILYNIGSRGVFEKVVCKNNKVYVLAGEQVDYLGEIFLFFIYDLKEGKWYGPERVGEKIRNEILSHNKELLKKYEPYEPYYGYYLITYFPEFDVDEEGRVHLFADVSFVIDKGDVRKLPPPIYVKAYTIYLRREPNGRWEEQIFKSFPPDEYPIYPLENTGIYMPDSHPTWVSAFGRKLAVGNYLGYNLVLKPEDEWQDPERHFIYMIRDEGGNWEEYDLADLLPEMKEVGTKPWQADAGVIGEDGNVYGVIWQMPTIYTKGVEVKALFLKIDTKEKKFKRIRRMVELERGKKFEELFGNWNMKMKGNVVYYASLWPDGNIYLDSWEVIGDEVGNIKSEVVGKVAWVKNLSLEVKKNVYLLNALNFYRKEGNRWIMEEVLTQDVIEKYKIEKVWGRDICVDDEGYAWVFFLATERSPNPFTTPPIVKIYYVRKKVE